MVASGAIDLEAGGLGERRLGRWEWVALPDFGISCMQAKLAPRARRSCLAIEGLASIDLDGNPGLRFRIYPLAGDPRTFVLAEAPLAKGPPGALGPRIETSLTLGEHTMPAVLELVPRRDEPLALILGRDALGGSFVVVPDTEALAGLPRFPGS